jgi:hypothetical protein
VGNNSETAILTDGSIVNFASDGGVILYPSKEWARPTKRDRFGLCHQFKYQTKAQAIDVWVELSRLLNNQNNYSLIKLTTMPQENYTRYGKKKSANCERKQ